MSNSPRPARILTQLILGAALFLGSAVAEDAQESITVRNKIKGVIEDNPIEVLSRVGQGGWCGWISNQPGTLYRNQTNRLIQDFVIYSNPKLPAVC